MFLNPKRKYRLQDLKASALDLTLKQLWERLNEKGKSVIAVKYYPSINNFCPKCKEELFDDGKQSKCPKCGSKTTKHFTRHLEEVPNYCYKHKLNEIYNDLKKVYFTEDEF